jgi:DNA-binding response OmpR family regulator
MLRKKLDEIVSSVVLAQRVGTTKKLFQLTDQAILWYSITHMADTKKVMVIEDDKFLSSLIKTGLERKGFTVLQAFDGEQATTMLRTEQPDLIILDLIMPKVNGFEVLQMISITPQLSKTPVIILSNLAQDSDVEKARALGAKEYFVKVKISIDDLLEKIKDLTDIP